MFLVFSSWLLLKLATSVTNPARKSRAPPRGRDAPAVALRTTRAFTRLRRGVRLAAYAYFNFFAIISGAPHASDGGGGSVVESVALEPDGDSRSILTMGYGMSFYFELNRIT
ncbi:hypothetical protein EVAR_39482_1 [Eumeta japonica]|uniref:Uncharacterized protein n=1 Tax=Eumeta variegata TaxID=151549 RepID=A0A4C1W086_EUMVA|nr:hypothetical protein EVAR_39482_1 [Eumeta japonica]